MRQIDDLALLQAEQAALTGGPYDSEFWTSMGFITFDIVAVFDRNAAAGVAKLIETIASIDQAWVSGREPRSDALPTWLLAECEREAEERPDAWTPDGWLDSMHVEDRVWWIAEIRSDANSSRFTIAADGLPTAWENLRFLVEAVGGNITEEP